MLYLSYLRYVGRPVVARSLVGLHTIRLAVKAAAVAASSPAGRLLRSEPTRRVVSRSAPPGMAVQSRSRGSEGGCFGW